ncbi:MAG: hypothetical protein AAGA17_04050 [Actinomycetota bacterium]
MVALVVLMLIGLVSFATPRVAHPRRRRVDPVRLDPYLARLHRLSAN